MADKILYQNKLKIVDVFRLKRANGRTRGRLQGLEFLCPKCNLVRNTSHKASILLWSDDVSIIKCNNCGGKFGFLISNAKIKEVERLAGPNNFGTRVVN